MKNNCVYCRCRLYGPEQERDVVCETCKEQVKKFDEKAIDWLMMVIDGRVEAEFDKHTDRYSHESNNYGYD